MAWEMQVLIDGEWKSIRPTGREVYRYPDEESARRMLKICYPLQIYGEEVRVKWVKEVPNMDKY